MAANFSLFRQEPDGSEYYIGDASTWCIALFQASKLASLHSGAKYVIDGEKMGIRVVVDLSPPQSPSSKMLDQHKQTL